MLPIWLCRLKELCKGITKIHSACPYRLLWLVIKSLMVNRRQTKTRSASFKTLGPTQMWAEVLRIAETPPKWHAKPAAVTKWTPWAKAWSTRIYQCQFKIGTEDPQWKWTNSKLMPMLAQDHQMQENKEATLQHQPTIKIHWAPKTKLDNARQEDQRCLFKNMRNTQINRPSITQSSCLYPETMPRASNTFKITLKMKCISKHQLDKMMNVEWSTLNEQNFSAQCL